MNQPDLSFVPEFQKPYLSFVEQMTIIEALEKSIVSLQECLNHFPKEKSDHRYASDKWSVKEMLCHLQDAERIFAYRALRFARNDKSSLQYFDEVAYGPKANAENRSYSDIKQELIRLRATTIDLFKSFSPSMLTRTGAVGEATLMVGNIGFLTAGHMLHHVSILKERYL